MADIFLSYARADEGQVERLHRALESHGVTVWRDRSIGANEPFGKAIRQQITSAKAVVVCWTPASAASEFVEEEADLAKKLGKYVGCLLAPTATLPLGFNRINSVDLVRWNEKSDDLPLLRLCEPLGRLIGGDSGKRLAGLAEARKLAEAASEAAIRAAREAELAREEYARRQQEIEQNRRQAERKRASQQAMEQERSEAQRFAPYAAPVIGYCIWVNPSVVSSTAPFLDAIANTHVASSLPLNVISAYVASSILWALLLRPGPVPPMRYLVAIALQWPLTWLILLLVAQATRLLT